MEHYDSARYSTTTPDYRTYAPPTYAPYTPPSERQTSSIAYLNALLIIEMFVSIVSLILSIIVFAKLPEFKNNIRGKNLMTMSFCLLTAYIFLCLDFAVRNHITDSFCYAIAVIIHFSFLGFFLWSSILALDMWTNIYRITQETFVENEGYWKRYLVYSIIAWTATLVAALPAFIFDGKDIVGPLFQPHFGRTRCWVSGIDAFTFYFNSPVGIVCLINSFIFISTMRRIYAIDQLVAYLQAQHQQKRLDLYVRLFFLMGMIWLLEFLSFITHKNWLYAVGGVVLALYGFFFGAIFLLNKRIKNQIKEHFFGIVTEKDTELPTRIPGPMCNITADHPLAKEVFVPRTNIFGEHRF